MSILEAPHFHDERAAYEWVEARVWPNGRVCPHCRRRYPRRNRDLGRHWEAIDLSNNSLKMAAKKKSQSRRFVEKAKELGADESGEAFEREFKRIVPQRAAKRQSRRRPSLRE